MQIITINYNIDMDSCILKPTVQNKKGKTVESKLFNDLLDIMDRSEAVDVYTLSKFSKFREDNDITDFDENGEPTIEAMINALGLKDNMKARQGLVEKRREIGAVKGSRIVAYDDIDDVSNRIVQFNRDNDDYVATAYRKKKKWYISVETKSSYNESKPKEFAFKTRLNKNILRLMNRWGYTLRVGECQTCENVFDPENAEITKDGLISIIRIKEGREGSEKLPEEFSHMVIEGIQYDPITKRLLNAVTPEVVKAVLGDEYDTYYGIYSEEAKQSNGEVTVEQLMQKEAAGQLLAESLKNSKLSGTIRFLANKVWNRFLNILPQSAEDEILDSVRDAAKYADDVAKMIVRQDENLSLDNYSIINSHKLYNTKAKVDKVEATINKGFELLNKKLHLLQKTSKTGEYDLKTARAINKIKSHLSKKEYAKGCTLFLSEALDSVKELQELVTQLKEEIANQDMGNNLKYKAKVLNSIQEFNKVYKPVIKEMKKLVSLNNAGEIEMESADAAEIERLANLIMPICDDIEDTGNELRVSILTDFYTMIWGEDKIRLIGKNRGDVFSIENLLKYASRDLGVFDSFVNSMSNASDPLLSLIDKAVKKQQIKRDRELEKIKMQLGVAYKKLKKAGYNDDFIYERFDDGNPTGMYISEIDHAKYLEARNEYKKKIKPQVKNYFDLKEEMDKWEKANNIEVKLDETGAVCKIPNPKIYHKGTDPNATVREIYNLSDAQMEYYNTIIELKKKCDSFLPASDVYLFLAPQIMNDVVEAAGTQSAGKFGKTVLKSIQNKYVRHENDYDFGRIDSDFGLHTERIKKVQLNLEGNEIQHELSVYYTQKISDPTRLSTQGTSAMLAYAGMAYDYNAMDEIVDLLELTRYQIDEREVSQYSSESKLVDDFTTLGNRIRTDYVKKGSESNIAKRFDAYMESVVYKRKKKDQGTLFGTELDTAKTIDALKEYTTLLSLGVNLFAGISNVTIGNMQMWIDAVGSEFFNLKDLAKARKQYTEMLPKYMGEYNSVVKDNKLALLIDRYNMLDEFFADLKDEKNYKNALSRLVGNGSVLFLNTLGEHTLHCRTALAVMNHQKMYEKQADGTYRELSLVDAYEVKELKDSKGEYAGSKLVLKPNVFKKTEVQTDTGGIKTEYVEFTAEDEAKMRMRIQKVNHSLHGAYSEEDKGVIHRDALGRLVMQFRQWMPEFYNRRYGKRYYDAELGEYREGYYRTVGRFFLNCVTEYKNHELDIKTQFNNLSDHQKANVKKAAFEMITFLILSAIMLSLKDGVKDTRNYWGKRMLLYQAKRFKTELGAGVPTLEILKNINTIIKAPAASLNTFDKLVDLLNFPLIFENIETGKYKNWNKWEKNAIQTLPLYNQGRRVYDLATEDYMFDMFN